MRCSAVQCGYEVNNYLTLALGYLRQSSAAQCGAVRRYDAPGTFFGLGVLSAALLGPAWEWRCMGISRQW